MNARLLSEAKKDIPLYLEDFKKFWESTDRVFTDADLTDCYATTLIFKNWGICLSHINIRTLDEILKELHEDINTSFFLAYFGLYRSAHMHLRSVIELSLQLLYFFQHEVEYGQWRLGDFRIKHEELTSYLKRHPAFGFPEAQSLIDNITLSWKHFSKHIHAEAPKYFQTTRQSSQTRTLSTADFGIWRSSFVKTAWQVNRLLLFFFKEKLNAFPTGSREVLLRKIDVNDLQLLGITP